MSVSAKVADLGSFAAATNKLRMSQTMIGKHIRFFEQRLGSQLINRSTPAHEQRSPQRAEVLNSFPIAELPAESKGTATGSPTLAIDLESSA